MKKTLSILAWIAFGVLIGSVGYHLYQKNKGLEPINDKTYTGSIILGTTNSYQTGVIKLLPSKSHEAIAVQYNHKDLPQNVLENSASIIGQTVSFKLTEGRGSLQAIKIESVDKPSRIPADDIIVDLTPGLALNVDFFEDFGSDNSHDKGHIDTVVDENTDTEIVGGREYFKAPSFTFTATDINGNTSDVTLSPVLIPHVPDNPSPNDTIPYPIVGIDYFIEVSPDSTLIGSTLYPRISHISFEHPPHWHDQR